MGGLLGGGGGGAKGMLPPLSNYWGGGGWGQAPLAPPLPTPMLMSYILQKRLHIDIKLTSLRCHSAKVLYAVVVDTADSRYLEVEGTL